MKLVAHVRKVSETGIHGIGAIQDGEVSRVGDLPLPGRVVIELEDDGVACMMYRFTKSGEFCGDTWHENLENAYSQAAFEYGLSKDDFVEMVDDQTGG